MKNILLLVLGLGVLTSCSTAKMAKDPGLEVNTVKYKITEQTKVFSGGNIVFGPYKATKISRSFVEGTNMSILGFGSKKKDQDYTYQFNGKNSWNGDCKVKASNIKIGRIEGGFNASLKCTFNPADSGSTSASGWKFNMKGDMKGPVSGSINMGSKTIKVKAINKIDGSPFPIEQHTGYYFYEGSTIIAGVDAINKEGPVWLNNDLSHDERDTISMVMVALILNQVN